MTTELNVGWSGFSEEFLDSIIALNAKYPSTQVTELYGSVRGLGATARSMDRIPAVSWHKLDYLVRKANMAKIELKWTLNFSCFGNMQDLGWDRYKDLLLRLADIGVTKFIVSVPLVASLVKDVLPLALVEVSTISRITSITELRDWYALGAGGVCWDVMQNRDFRLLEEACRMSNSRGKYVEVLTNELCTHMCIYRNHCYNLSSHSSSRDAHEGYPFGWCITTRAIEPWRWIASRFVLPEHLSYYEELGVTRFKVSGRTYPPEKVLPILECYMKRESPPNLLDLWPHINPLVDDPAKPEQDLFISTVPLKRKGFLRIFESQLCSTFCQAPCTYCNAVFKECTA